MIYVDKNIESLYRTSQPEGRGNYLRLDQNENPEGIPGWLFDKIKDKITPEFLSIYPEEGNLTKKYAEYLNLNVDNVTLTCGSVVAMGYALRVFGEPGKDLLVVTPTFGMYKVYADMVGMNTVSVPYNSDYTFDVNNIISAINDNTGIIVLVNPNMPMGNVYSQEDIEKIVKIADEKNILVIVDEAYHYFYDQTSLNLINKYDNVLIFRTFSKMLSIPALRLGAVISNPNLIRCIKNNKPHYTINSIALLVGEAIIDNIDDVLTELKNNFFEGKKYLFKRLAENDYEVIDSEGCFMCLKPKKLSVDEMTDKLKENGILIFPGKGFLENYIRVTIAGKKYMEHFLDCFFKLDK